MRPARPIASSFNDIFAIHSPHSEVGTPLAGPPERSKCVRRSFAIQIMNVPNHPADYYSTAKSA